MEDGTAPTCRSAPNAAEACIRIQMSSLRRSVLRANQWRSVRYLDVHKADDPTLQQKKNHGAKYEQETAVEERQPQRDQRPGNEDESANAPLLFTGVEPRMGRMEVRK
jgi:hypothetical protein